MNENELKFILRMRDEASAILSQHAEAMGQVGGKAKNLKNDVNAASGSLMDLARHAKEATEAVAALWTANEVAHKSLETFREYERGMQVVARTTKIAGEAMVDFQAKFDAMAAATKGASVNNLVEFAEVAGQLGIRGQADVLKFSETIGKLTTVTDIAGEEGAKQFGRLLLLTGEGAKGTQKLADSLSGLQSTTKASAAEILMLASQLAQTTAGFKLGTDALTGLAAAAAQLNIQPYLLSNAVGRTLRELKDGALNATGGMKDLTTMLGTSREEFLKLIETNPDQAMLRFLNVIRQIGASGGSVTGFLQKFQLQGDESQKVLLTLAKNVDEVNEKVQESKNLQNSGGSLDNAYAGFSKTLDAELKGLSNSWDLFAKNLGKALAPTVKEVLHEFSDLLNGASNLMQAMPDLGQKFVAWSAVGVPALFGIHRVLGMFPGIMTTIQGGLVALGRQFGIMAGQAGAAAAVTAEAEATMAAGGAAGGAGLAGKLMKGVGIASLFVGAHEVGKAIAGAMNEYTPETADAIARWRDGLWAKIVPPKPEEKKKVAEAVLGAQPEMHDRPAVPNLPELPAPKPIFEATDANKQALERFDKYSKLVEDLKKAESALQALREGSAKFGAGGDARSENEIKAIERAIEAERRSLDPMNRLRDSWHDQLAAAQALTKEQQNQAEIEKAIAEERRNNPRFTDKDAEEVRSSMRAIQSTTRLKSFDEEFNSLQKQLSATRALTAADKERVEIDQQIADFVRQNGELTAEQERAMRRILALQKETAEAAALANSLNAQGQAIQNYERQVKLLQQMGLNAEQMSRAMAQLNRETEAARNPLGAIATQNEHELEMLTRTGHYREAEVAALQQKYDLQQKGVEVDDKMLADLTEYQRRLQDLKEAQNTGFAGWANKVKDVQGQLQDLAGEFSNDLSSAIVGALEGKRNAFAEAGRALGAAMIKMSVDGLMKQAYNALGLTDTSKQAAAALAASDKLRQDGEAQMKQAVTQTMAVQAGVVNIQGSSGGPLTGGQTVDGKAATVQSIAPSGNSTPLPAVDKLRKAMTDATAPKAAEHVEAAKKALGELKPYNPNASLESVYGPGVHGMFGDKLSDGIPATDWRVKAASGVDGAKIESGLKDGLARLKEVVVGGGGGGGGRASAGAPSASAVAEPSAPMPKPRPSDLGSPASPASPFGDLKSAQQAFASAKTAIPSGMADKLATGGDISGMANYQGGSLNSVQGFIVHHSGGRGTPEGVVNTLNQRHLGVQWVMDRDGKVFRTLPEGAKGAHILPSEINGLSNRNTEGMEVIAKDDSDLTAAQKAAFVPWMRKYQKEHPGAQVFGHGEVNPHHKMASEGRTLTEEWREASRTQPKIERSTPDIPLKNRTLMGFAHGSIDTDGANNAMQEAMKNTKAAQEAMRQQMEQMSRSATSNLGSLTQGIGGVGQKALSAVPSMDSFGSSITSMLSSLTKGMGGGMGGGGGGFGSLFGSLFGAMHTGGVVGVSPAMGLSRHVSPMVFAGAPRFHAGLTSDEFPAILQRGERVLTAQQDQRASALMGRMADMLQTGSAAGAGAPAPQRPQVAGPRITMNIQTPNASSFRYSHSQIMAQTSAQMSRASAKHN